MCDVWRASYPDGRDFSRRQVVNGVLKQSRIDLCFVTAPLCKFIMSPKYVVNPWSDHSTFLCALETVTTQRGGMWCLNASLLEDALFVSAIRNMLNNAVCELPFVDHVLEWWVHLKKRIKSKCIHYSKDKRWKDSAFEQKVRHLVTTEAKLLDEKVITCTNKCVA